MLVTDSLDVFDHHGGIAKALMQRDSSVARSRIAVPPASRRPGLVDGLDRVPAQFLEGCTLAGCSNFSQALAKRSATLWQCPCQSRFSILGPPQ